MPLPQYSIMRNMSKRTLWGLFLAIFLLGAFLRFWWISDIPVGLYIDEAMNGNNALEALQTRNFKLFYPENNGREGLFINLQALALSLLGREPWVLRSVSAVIGTLTILGIFLLCLEIFTKEHFLERTKKLKEDGTFHAMYRLHDSQIIALLAAFFLATSYWHLNFSRIGFRAIFVPLLTTFGFYFLLRGLRRGGIFDLTLGGLITGLGFHTYIAFRVVPGIAAIPILWYLRVWWKNRKILLPEGGPKKPCIPCSIVLFAIMAVVIALPIGLYFFDNPQDFSGRSGQVSVLAADNPAYQLARSSVLTGAMLFFFGDCNWRHNLPCKPELNPFVALSFAVGLMAMIGMLLRKRWREDNIESIHAGPMEIVMLFVWIALMSLPAVLTKEGLPHALRSIGMIPPVIIIAAFGAWWLLDRALEWFEGQKGKYPNFSHQLSRIQKEIVVLAALSLLFIPVITYRDYFLRWAFKPNTHEAFTVSLLNLGNFLERLPRSTQKYVVVNSIPWVRVRGYPMEAQPIMFATETMREENREQKNIRYLNTEELSALEILPGQKAIIAIVDPKDKKTFELLKNKFPEMKIKAPADFIIFETQ